MCGIDPRTPNFLDQKAADFKELHGTMDSLFRKLRQEGIGAEVKHAGMFTREEENCLWEKRVLGARNPFALLRSVFFYNCKKFCLRGGEEHGSLKISQMKRSNDAYVYTENGSKNRSGGLASSGKQSSSFIRSSRSWHTLPCQTYGPVSEQNPSRSQEK